MLIRLPDLHVYRKIDTVYLGFLFLFELFIHLGGSKLTFIFILCYDVTKTAVHIDGLAQNCSNIIAKALELLQSCTRPSVYVCRDIYGFRSPVS